MKPIDVRSVVVKPGELVTVCCFFAPPWPSPPFEFSRLHLDRDVATARHFQIERIDVLTSREAEDLAKRHGVGALSFSGALLVRVKNMGTEARAFVGTLSLLPSEDAIRDEAARVMDRDWKAAFDRAMRELRARTPSH